MRFILTLLALVSSAALVFSQPSKREFRAAWIATVANIDWPSKPGLPAVEQQEQFVRRLDQLKDIGCNTVIVQIRPASDAFYASGIEPWSHYLTGRQGQPPFPYYDPLAFMIAETHKRNMEFHAWFNPFRALVDSKNNPNPPGHITYAHPEWVINYGGKAYIDPGYPGAREYVVKVISDVVKRYDIDAVHLDDYFYPYKVAGQQFGDFRSYSQFGKGEDRDDWRRSNVSLFISELHTNVREIKPYVKLGISPFGIWRNMAKDPDGSATQGGQTDYDDLYADVLLWMRKGWIDYLLPQVYWEHGGRAAPFDVLLPWWNRHSYGRHIYYGLGLYRMVDAGYGPWRGTHELLWQIRDVRSQAPSSGYALYSASNLDKIRSIADSLRVYNRFPAMPPRMKWIDSIPPAAPYLKAIPSVDGTLLQWQTTNPLREPLKYVVYRFVDNEAINLEQADHILGIQAQAEYLDGNANKYRKCTYVVTAVDRLWNESRPSNAESTYSGR